MINIGKKGLVILLTVMMLVTCSLGAVYADQPYRGTVKHKATLRNADIGRAENTYTDLNGDEQDTDKNTVNICGYGILIWFSIWDQIQIQIQIII